jgi:sugar/nucleoside kinase (ribokinase family)
MQMHPAKRFDVVGIGSAIVDLLAEIGDIDVASFGAGGAGLVKGGMSLVDTATSAAILAAVHPVRTVSGGSVANTLVGIAELGGRAAFIGKLADDDLGRAFAADIRAAGVDFEPVVVDRPSGGEPAWVTGHCAVLVSSDAERTMATHLGVASTFGPGDIDHLLLDDAEVLYTEAYLWDAPAARQAVVLAMEAVHRSDGSVALSLSDPTCVERHRLGLLELLAGQVDVLLGNEDEARLLFDAKDLDSALAALEDTGLLAVVTRGAGGSLVVTHNGVVEVPAVPVDNVVDTTGAGDLFAAGFLFALTHGQGPVDAAHLGSACAAEAVSHLGARPETELRRLVESVEPR